jgi:hypothetical protein
VSLEFLVRVVARVVDLRLGRDDLIRKVTRAVLLAGFDKPVPIAKVSRIVPPRPVAKRGLRSGRRTDMACEDLGRVGAEMLVH